MNSQDQVSPAPAEYEKGYEAGYRDGVEECEEALVAALQAFIGGDERDAEAMRLLQIAAKETLALFRGK